MTQTTLYFAIARRATLLPAMKYPLSPAPLRLYIYYRYVLTGMQLPDIATLMEHASLSFSPLKSKWNRSVGSFLYLFPVADLTGNTKEVKIRTIDFGYYIWLPWLLKLWTFVIAEFFSAFESLCVKQ
jgi:hypothetical protein